MNSPWGHIDPLLLVSQSFSWSKSQLMLAAVCMHCCRANQWHTKLHRHKDLTNQTRQTVSGSAGVGLNYLLLASIWSLLFSCSVQQIGFVGRANVKGSTSVVALKESRIKMYGRLWQQQRQKRKKNWSKRLYCMWFYTCSFHVLVT